MRTTGELVATVPGARRSRTFVLFVAFFVVMHALPLWQMAADANPPVFVVIDTFGVFLGALSIGYWYARLRDETGRVSFLDCLVGAYLLLGIASAILYLQSGNPARPLAYLYGVHYVVFPALTFFAVKWLEPRERAGLVKVIVALNMVLVGTGLVMFYWQPEFYTEYVVRSLHNEVTELWQVYGRVRSYLGSTTVGFMAGLSLLLAGYFPMGIVVRSGVCGLFAVGGILSQQRGAYVAVTLGLLYQTVFRAGRLSRKTLWAMVLVATIASAFVMFGRRNAAFVDRLELLSYTQNRVVNESLTWDIFAERRAGYDRGWETVRSFPLGLGLGATLSASDSAGANPGGQVVDANYMRVLSDLGLPGLFLFVAILLMAMRRAWKNRPRALWLSVFAVYAILALGTNVFDSYYLSHVYWTLLGMIDSGPISGEPADDR